MKNTDMLINDDEIRLRLIIQAGVLLLFLLLLSVATYADEQETFSSFNIEDLKMLGVIHPPEGAFVQEEYKGIKFVASPENRYSEDQLILLKYFVDRVPPVLLKYGPSAVVNGEVGFLPSLAQASGPYIYFDSSAFHTGGFWSAGSLEEVFRGFVHELVHVYQFGKAMEIVDLREAREKFSRVKRQTIWKYAVMRTELVDSFARITGWKLRRGRITTASLKNSRAERTSNYGRVSIIEDMAETVSFVVIGNLTQLSERRVGWAMDLLEVPLWKEAMKYTFPYSDRFKLVKMRGGVTKFDHSKKKEYGERYRVIDLAHFIGKEDGHYEEMVSELKQGFEERGWEKTLSKSLRLEHGVKKSLLEYRGKWRDVYVEVISYEDATGYLTKPEKTIITVLSGYRL